MKKTAEQIADSVLVKCAISPSMARRAILQGSERLVAKTPPAEVAQKAFEFFKKHILTNLRSQDVLRADMPQAKKELLEQFDFMKSLGAMK